jgi:hypothetical protein
MDLHGEINTEQALIGLMGVVVGGALFFFSNNGDGIYQTLAGFSILLVLFSIGYAITGHLVTSSIVPAVMFITVTIAGLVPRLPDGSALKSALLIILDGKVIFLFAIAMAVAFHMRSGNRK